MDPGFPAGSPQWGCPRQSRHDWISITFHPTASGKSSLLPLTRSVITLTMMDFPFLFLWPPCIIPAGSHSNGALINGCCLSRGAHFSLPPPLILEELLMGMLQELPLLPGNLHRVGKVKFWFWCQSCFEIRSFSSKPSRKMRFAEELRPFSRVIL